MSASENETVSSLETGFRSGVVLRKESDFFAVWFQDEELLVPRAAGCLLDPQPGDRVLLVCPSGEVPLILSVLSRASGEKAQLSFPSGLDLSVAGKPLTFRASEGIGIETEKFFRVVCGECEVEAGRVSLTALTMSWAAESCSLVARTFRIAAQLFETLSGHIETKAGSAHRRIDTVDHVQSGQTTLETESLFSLTAGSALIEARDLARIDSGQVHLG